MVVIDNNAIVPPAGNPALNLPTPPAGTIAPPANNNLVVTGGPATTQFNTHSSDLSNLLGNLNQQQTPGTNTATLDNTNDSFTQALDRISGTSDAATKALIGSIQANRQTQKNAADTEYGNYKSGLQLLGIQHNDAQSTPDLLAGHITKAENDHTTKLQSIETETNKALVDAQTAKDNKDLSTLKDKMSYIKDLNQQKQDYLKNIADNMSNQTKIADSQIGNAYDALLKLNPKDQEQYLQVVAQKYNIPLGSLVKSMVTEKQQREKDALDLEDKRSIIANRNKTNAGSDKAITTAKLNYLKKNNPLVDADLTNTEGDVNQYITNSKNFIDYTKSLYQDKSNLGPQGYFTFDAVKQIVDQIPEGLDKGAYLKQLYDEGKITPSLEKKGDNGKPNYENYGLTQDEADTIMGN